MRMNTVTPGLLSLAILGGCASQKSEAAAAATANCPPGQSFDGQFCQADQSVATAETPVAASTTADASGGAPSEVSDVTSPTGGATADDLEEHPTDEVKETLPVEEASPVDITMAAQAAPVIQYLASSHLPSGARQFGAPFAGQFAEGQVLTQKLQVTKGKCYTVVAVAMPPVSELNVFLFKEDEDEPLTEDTLKGNQAVIGSRGSCYMAEATESLRLVLQVEKGSGVAAGQVFQK